MTPNISWNAFLSEKPQVCLVQKCRTPRSAIRREKGDSKRFRKYLILGIEHTTTPPRCQLLFDIDEHLIGINDMLDNIVE